MVQLELPVKIRKTELLKEESHRWSVEEDKIFLEIKDEKGYGYAFHKIHGALWKIYQEGENILEEPMRLSVWRAPTDNDRRIKEDWGLYEDNMRAWNMNRVFWKCYEMHWERTGEDIRIIVRESLAGVSRTPILFSDIEYLLTDSGWMKVSANIEVGKKVIWLPRLGFQLSLPYSMEKMEYFGMGPGENYQDLCHYTRMGKFCSSATKEYVPYIKPQEHGNHTRIKYLKVWDGETNKGIHVVADTELECQVLHHTAEELSIKKHRHELKENGTNVRLDYRVSGIGSASCGTKLMDRYRLSEKQINFALWIKWGENEEKKYEAAEAYLCRSSTMLD